MDHSDLCRHRSQRRNSGDVAAGTTYNGGEAGRLVGERTPATVIGHENVLKRMTMAKFPELAWPTETYYIPTYKMSQYINGEGIQMYNTPAAITDADTIVYFRFSDVISAGDLFTPGRYPNIDVARGYGARADRWHEQDDRPGVPSTATRAAR